FAPIVEPVKDEHAFLTEHPLTVMGKGKAHKVPLLIGLATHEGLLNAATFKIDSNNFVEFESKLTPALKTIFATFVKENIFRIETPFSGIGHGADLLYYFPLEEFGMVVGKEDKFYQHSKDLVKMVVQFANAHDKMEFRSVKILPTPSEDLRDPQPIDEWTNVIDGREIGPECAQVDNMGFGSSDIYGIEDCLHLNVFAPKKLREDTLQGKRAKQPVLVWIHGGGFVLGSGKFGSP
ncbi:unnamed protein product, partial [Allacma fusca]